MPTNRKEDGLAEEAQTDCEKIKTAVEGRAFPRRQKGTDQRREKTERGSDQELAIHREQPL